MGRLGSAAVKAFVMLVVDLIQNITREMPCKASSICSACMGESYLNTEVTRRDGRDLRENQETGCICQERREGRVEEGEEQGEVKEQPPGPLGGCAFLRGAVSLDSTVLAPPSLE